jgi:hypothetical protein
MSEHDNTEHQTEYTTVLYHARYDIFRLCTSDVIVAVGVVVLVVVIVVVVDVVGVVVAVPGATVFPFLIQ